MAVLNRGWWITLEPIPTAWPYLLSRGLRNVFSQTLAGIAGISQSIRRR
jgi:hypothetical protein